MDMEENNLKKIRINLGLTVTALAKLADVSTKTISQLERLIRDATKVTKSKIVIGLNLALEPDETRLTYEDVFPAD